MAKASGADDAHTVDVARGPHAGSGHVGAPFQLAMGLIAGLAMLSIASSPVRDIDAFWHILVGDEILDRRSLSELGSDWSLWPVAAQSPWTSTQWLAEVLFSLLYRSLGWPTIALFTLLSSATALLLLARATLRVSPPIAAIWPFAIATWTVVIAGNDRPQQFSFVGAAWLGGVLVTGLRSRALPAWWLVLLAVALWANLHGGWILVPAVLMLLVIHGVLDDRDTRDRFAGRALLLTGLAIGAGALSPTGLANVTAVLRFSEAASLNNEWQRVEPISALGASCLLMAGLLGASWYRSRSVPRGEVVAGILLILFSLTAWRNIAPSMLIVAPLVASRVAIGFPSVLQRQEPRWSPFAGAVVASVALIAAVPLAVANSDPTEQDLPRGILQLIESQEPNPRVLSTYNTAGAVLLYGGDTTKVAIDGRTDLYGREYIERFVETLNLSGDFQDLLGQLDPNLALLRADSGLAWYLEQHEMWRRVQTEDGYILLSRPREEQAGA